MASHSLDQVWERQALQYLDLITQLIYWLPHLSIDCMSEPNLTVAEWQGTEGTQGLKALTLFS